MKTNSILVAFIFLLFFAGIILAITETEPNDDLDHANNVSINTTITGSADEWSDYDDYFRVYLNSGDFLLAELSGESGTDFDLYIGTYTYNEVYNFTFLTPLNSSKTESYPETASITAPESDYYYIQIYVVSGGGSGNYSLTLSQEMCVKGEIPPCDGIVSDFELLNYIKQWSNGLVGDFDLLEAIKNWAS